ncbi:uncharacterized protein LOC120516555 isoform X3 [Polypterus senegalus]|uniref:uncharacterized protein LOC120516555 isoform X3 n=1 Tax=Polypterus senegalus TaxID=55291 RepID=UPI0019653EF0|nr:uncharacterized protein LOC120516555 isoform X3 [Polypterus senegalus]
MSESFVRKIQPFTIGTKLSVPTVSKCTEFTNTYLPDPELDNCNLRHNLNEKIPLYLGNRELHTETSHFSPVANRLLQVDRSQEEISEEDHENSNGAAQATSSRSIRKITISSGLEKALDKVASSPKMTITKPENINNNNNACRVLPRIVGVSCENKPNSQFKVLLRKESVDEEQNVAGSPSSPASWHTTDTATPHHLIPLSSPLLSKKEPSKIDNSATGDEVNNSPTVARQQNDCSLTQRTAQFNKELSQAETWIRRKLQDLKDGSNIQRYPLQDWEQISQTLQRELKDFENTLIQLNQMGEQLISKQNPMSEMVRKQLNQLKEQWQILKLTAANQSKAVGSAKNLQEFNRKVDKLEDWIKEKEEKKCLALLLEDNIDKIQLTRKILDLKQDEQQYRALHDEINSMALKLEKQGKNEGKNISTRRKHINKMWLKAQALIKDHHENLQLALEASSFYQQADTIIRTANAKRKCISSSSGQENSTDRDMRDIASQIMMLDVTVSQLSNLHPILAARVTQKQKEVKDSWVLLQQAVRNEKSNLQSSCSDFTREAGDPLTSTRESQCSVGKEAHRIMGKEVKEEQNRLKGCVISSLGVREPGTNRKSIKSQDEEQLSKPITETGSNPNETDDVTDRRQTEGGRKKKNDTKAASLRENSQVHIQLQKFTISADKTLLWLKDNVAMATKICCTENQDGLESAKRCQAALEDEIISNSSRIELVKKEGRSLVRAQHPGSAKIEEFLGQLEVLWEELIKRHQKNDILLEESERLNIKSFKVQKDMNDLGQWLKTVESSISSDTPLSGDPESMSAAERESSLLKVEVVSRGMELRALKQEVEKLRHRRHYLAEKLQSQMGQLEDIYLSVLSALKQQTSELQDTRMLTEFLEKVQREENQIQKRSLDKSQHRDTTLPESCPLPLVEVDPHFIDSGRFDSDNIADPMEELREAVEMLNDTVRERGMSLTEELEIEDLFILHSNISLRISQLMSKNRELCAEIPKVETEMAVKCKPDLCALENLTNQQEDMEIDYEVVKEEVEELENQTIRFETLRAHALEEEVRRTLKAWEDLGTIIAESRERLNQARLLQDFFRNYLAMISWTEETRSCIFSENAAKLAEVGQTAMTKELDIKIEQKFQEFEELAAAGQKLINEDHHLTMIKERTDELRSMLGWILVRWKTQKHHLNHGKRKSEPKGDIIYSEAMVSGIPLPDQQEEKQDSGERPMGCQLKLHEEQRMLISSNQTENCYEEMASISQRPGNVKLSAASGSQPLSTDAHDSPLLVLKESSTSSLGGTVNLIFSFNKTADSHLQVTDSMDETEVREPIHRPCDSKSSGCKNFWKRCQGLLENTFGSLKRKTKISRQNAEEVSTYLHVENNNKAMPPLVENVTLPCTVSKEHLRASTSPLSKISSVSFLPMSKISCGSVFSSLKRRGKTKNPDARRHTIQKIMAVDSGMFSGEKVQYNTYTWPLREKRKKKSFQNPVISEPSDYVKNPLAKDIDSECVDIMLPKESKSWVKAAAVPPVNKNCKHLSLGSVLSVELPKDLSLISGIPGLIKIEPQEAKVKDGLDSTTELDFQKLQTRKGHLDMTVREVRGCPNITAGEHSRRVPLSKMFTKNHDNFPCQTTLNKNSSSILPNKSTICHISSSCHMSKESILATAATQDSGDDIYLSEPSSLPGINVLCEEASREWDRLAAAVSSEQYERANCAYTTVEEGHCQSNVLRMPSVPTSEVIQVVHELSVKENLDFDRTPGHATKDQMNKATTAQKYESIPYRMQTKAERSSSKCEGKDVKSSSSHGLDSDSKEPFHPDHQQFEEEEAELEDIWNKSEDYRQSICSDIMYQTYKQDEANSSLSQPVPDITYRKLVTTSAPNLLVAEFRLPTPIQTLLGYTKGSTDDEKCIAKSQRKSWAAFSHNEQTNQQIALINETASDSVKLPNIDDKQKYIYKYREEEEEEEESINKFKDHSLSLLSVHMGLENNGKEPLASDTKDYENMEQMEALESRGLSDIMNGRRLVFQSMEGTLERKHMLQFGGKKAASRTWNTYHAVLFKQTLCFYQDRKDTLRSCIAGMPLNLTGAVCSPAPDYTKKMNCFLLQLRDGSEYLLSAPSRFLMKKWILKIQANTGVCLMDSSRPITGCLATADVKSIESYASSSTSSVPQESSNSSFPEQSLAVSSRAKEITVLTRENVRLPSCLGSHMQELSTPLSTDRSHQGDYYGSLRQAMKQKLSQRSKETCHLPEEEYYADIDTDLMINKRRSHSFTSAAYQKITPVSMPFGKAEGGSSYSVTLFIGDHLTEVPSRQCQTILNSPPQAVPQEVHLPEWHPEFHLHRPSNRNYGSLPRARNKSVFKKFFGKKE